jgi:hypothetical protein
MQTASWHQVKDSKNDAKLLIPLLKQKDDVGVFFLRSFMKFMKKKQGKFFDVTEANECFIKVLAF